MRVNFILPPAQNISGGPLAILEYAKRLSEKGHSITMTTYPDIFWGNPTNPWPWFELPDTISIYYKQMINQQSAQETNTYLQTVPDKNGFRWIVREALIQKYMSEVMPDCDLNVATWWTTAFAAYYSEKGKPVYFMQHFEEAFHSGAMGGLAVRMGAKNSYVLPTYKVANSSWLKKVIFDKYGQDIPFSNNAIDIKDFTPEPKKSEEDGVIRIVTYSHPTSWKGFVDAATAMSEVVKKYGDRVKWEVFGYKNPNVPENHPQIGYTYHPKLSFKDLSSLYATSDIVLCPSWYESFPLPPLEGMACETAVITTEYGTEDYAKNGYNSLVVKPRDIQSLYNAIDVLITNKGLRYKLAKAGRETAETFTWEKAVNDREQILFDINNDNVKYDVRKSTKLGIFDAFGTEFE